MISSRFTLENYFQLHDGKAIDFRLRVQKDQNNQYSFYIHPQDVNGETWDFKVIGNFLECTTSTSEALNSLLVDAETLSSLDKNVLFLMIKQVASKISELEMVNTSQRDQLFKRVEALEEFQREYETAQEYERDRS
ncbi:hypothetical protein VF14_26895 [Nostoc linckia z18]|uniref:Uncharacterized protein n=2 Tax=Nostoc linckia TaxID=92942 RepID=A0A9Q6EJM8_NOSLI|nr:hypothetical protein [Nostoc linckia]PHK38790.1 hypothetical protein VF12_16840 [Nostoc linckia z15]PHK44308.1 hypothetical protein VF13_22520 [Nostoc linckia z16]PHJ62788.1 hypothetical protein VF02_16700 [Nostoc linckia z1]PHJ66618.1 hypothetical protein VF05_18975 [Nostoc linckia z3]PHJ72739.1 hypothetical protein VF03_18075 [Nostoc linckia z2]